MRFLVVEDNARLASSLAEGLREEGHDVDVALTRAAASAATDAVAFDLVLLDLALPDGDGMDLIRSLRDRGSQCPILVVSARDGVDARIAALDAGADDYVIKPFAFAELVARTRALARRALAPRPLSMHLGFELRDDLTVRADSVVVTLSPKEHALLRCLSRRHGEVVSRTDILLEVFGYAFDPGTNAIDVHLSHLRRKCAELPFTIETVRGAGFRLVLV